MTYSAEYSSEARSYLRRASPDVRERVWRRVEALCIDPFNADLSKALHGSSAGVRVSRIGALRIMYEVYRERLLITVVRIGPRGDIYRN